MMDIGILFINDTQFSLSNMSDGISIAGRISQEEFEKFIKTYYIDVLEVVHKVRKDKL